MGAGAWVGAWAGRMGWEQGLRLHAGAAWLESGWGRGLVGAGAGSIGWGAVARAEAWAV